MKSLEPARLAPDRRAQALGVVEPQRIHAGGIVAGLGAGLDRGVAEPRAVHVQGDAGGARHRGHALHGGERPHRAEAAIGGVLDRHQPRARRVAAVGIAQGGLHLLAGEHAVGAFDRPDHDAGIGGRAAGLGVDDVRGPIGDHLVAQAAMDADGGLVGHGAARQEQRVLLAQKLADPLAQPVDGGILHLLLVAHLGVGHGLSHAGRGLGLGVAVKIDETVLHGVSCSPAPPYDGGESSQRGGASWERRRP